jgi:hypothetical protein
LELATYVLGEESTKGLEIVHLSGNTVRRLIQELSANTEKQLVSLLRSSVVFIPQFAELTIVSWLAVLPVFLRCLFDNKTEED